MKKNLKMKFGQRIKELRIANNLTQENLAELVGMERTNITRIEAGKHFPTAENLEKFTIIFNVTANELFEIEHHKSKEELIEEIITILSNCELKKIKFIYKDIINLKNI